MQCIIFGDRSLDWSIALSSCQIRHIIIFFASHFFPWSIDIIWIKKRVPRRTWRECVACTQFEYVLSFEYLFIIRKKKGKRKKSRGRWSLGITIVMIKKKYSRYLMNSLDSIHGNSLIKVSIQRRIACWLIRE